MVLVGLPLYSWYLLGSLALYESLSLHQIPCLSLTSLPPPLTQCLVLVVFWILSFELIDGSRYYPLPQSQYLP